MAEDELDDDVPKLTGRFSPAMVLEPSPRLLVELSPIVVVVTGS